MALAVPTVDTEPTVPTGAAEPGEPRFSGPVEVLYRVVASHEADVVDIPLAPVVDAFVAELAAKGSRMPLDQVSEFLLYAAILVELKAKSLLPGPDELEPDEELREWEMRDVLVSRLLECRAYAAAAEIFAQLTELATRSFPRVAGIDDGFTARPRDLLAGVEPCQLAEAYVQVARSPPSPKVDLSHVAVDTVSVAEAVDELLVRLPVTGWTTFRSLTEHLVLRIEVIVRFLALLELCKLGKVELGQGHTFGDLEIAWIGERSMPPGTLPAVGRSTLDEYDELDEYDG